MQAFALYQDKEVGIEVLFGPEWRQPSFGPAAVGIGTGTVMIRSVGPASDSFIVALDQIYGTHLLPRTMRDLTPFSAVTLDGDPADLKRGKVETKLFYEAADAGSRNTNTNDDEEDSDDRSAELYLNIDVKAGTLHIGEKDEAYRSAIVQALRRF